MILDILYIIHISPRNNETYGNLKTFWYGSLTKNVSYSVESHEQHNGFEDPDNMKIALNYKGDILTICQDYSTKMPNDTKQVRVYGKSSELIKEIYDELDIHSKKKR